jgi:Phage gp6-like head-tail connector protein
MKTFLILGALALSLGTCLAASAEPETLNVKPKTFTAMAFEIIHATGTPVTLEMAKKQVNLDADFDEDNDLLQMYIDGAVGAAESYIERNLYETRVYSGDGFNACELTAWADASIEKIEYATVDEFDMPGYAVLDAANYDYVKVTNTYGALRYKGTLPEFTPGDAAVKVTVNSVCPAQVKNAILWHVGYSYAKRDGIFTDGEMVPFYNALRPYRKF